MAATLRYLGFVLLAALVAVYMLKDMVALGDAKEFLTPSLFTQVAGLGAIMIAAGFVLPILGGAAGVVTGKRCARCGRRVEKGQTYCRDHMMATIHELRDRARQFDDTSVGRRPKK